MIEVLLYFILLLLIIFLCSNLLSAGKKYCPVKVKNSIIILSLLTLLKYATLLAMSLLESQKYINYFKPMIFLEFIFVPSLLAINFYIYRRSEKMSFSINNYIMAILSISYLGIMYFTSGQVQISQQFGYVLNLSDLINYYLAYLTLPIFILIGVILEYDKPFVNRKGFAMLGTTIIILFGEGIINLCGLWIFPYPIVGEFLVILLTTYSVYLFKR